MIFQNPPFRRSSAALIVGLLLSIMLAASRAYAADVQDITVGAPGMSGCPVNTDYSYAAKASDPNATNTFLGQNGASGNVQWSFADIAGGPTQCAKDAVDPKIVHCGGLNIAIPNDPDDPDPAKNTAPPGSKVTVTGHPTTTAEGFLTLKVIDSAAGNKCGVRKYTFHTTDNGGGWGDPHMTTIGGVSYDFQAAGEFIALKHPKFEVQTRQRPVPTASPATDPNSGLNLCVSIYSAVAARIGSNRVTLEPNLNGQPDPSSLQLRVNGNLVTNIPEDGYALRANASSDPSALLEGRIVRAAGGAYEFDDVGGTQLVATPDYWTSQQTWYLNLKAYQTVAVQGIWGQMADKSWLPALPDGTSLGPMPPMMNERYQALYDKFGNAWRVTDATSLFDYAPGTNTATFTMADWPRFGAQSCLIQGQTPAQPTTQQIAAQACSAITNATEKANCTFDVMVTGNLGFAQTYTTMQGFRPHGSGWQPALPGTGATGQAGGGPGGPGTGGGWKNWPWWVWVLILILILILIALWFWRKNATP